MINGYITWTGMKVTRDKMEPPNGFTLNDSQSQIYHPL